VRILKTPTKFVTKLKAEEQQELKRLMKEDPSSRVRMRAHSVLLSNREYSIDEIADIYEADRDSVTGWIDNWIESGYEGLLDQPKSGRPRLLDEKEEEQVKELVKQEPRSIKRVADQIQKKRAKR
jgi:transposase